MTSHRLSFGEIIILKENLAEVIVDDGVEMDMDMVEEYHDFLLSYLSKPILLLVNKKHSYSYTGEAQLNIADLEEIKAIGVVSYSKPAMSSTTLLNSIPREHPWTLKLFDDKKTALHWLESLQFTQPT